MLATRSVTFSLVQLRVASDLAPTRAVASARFVPVGDCSVRASLLATGSETFSLVQSRVASELASKRRSGP